MADIWQIAAGEKDKDLVPLMLEKNLMLIGPGEISDISGMDKSEVSMRVKNKYPKDKRIALNLLQFRDVKNGAIVVLRLGSVCFAIGAICGEYEWREEFDKVYSSWNKEKEYRKNEEPWSLKHTRKVEWFILKDREALCYFRRGIYAKQGFCHVQEAELKEYLKGLGYNGTNGREVLEKIGTQTKGVNRYGFPTPAEETA